MRWSLAFVTAAFLAAAAVATAHEEAGAGKKPSAASEGNDAAPAKSDEPPVFHPPFKPTKLKAPFLEQFLDGWEKRWSPSEATKKADSEAGKDDPDLWTYRGKWQVEEPTVYPGFKGDRGLVLKTAAAHHAISAPFSKLFDPAGKDLVVQYEVKLQKGLECGGAYLKLLQASEKEGIQAKQFTNETPYTIMFGPDKCGSTNKVHFIFRHQNPKTGEYEEKHLDPAPSARTDKVSTLYTLIVRPDNTFEIRVNNEKVSFGSLLENFNPPVNPPKEIVDPDDKKPVDWVDQAKIPDPDAKKPDDWDEDAPFEILDLDAKMPDNWYEDEPETVPDPDAVKPADWSDEEDGEWVAPMIPNPKCEDAAGCGTWKRPMKRNPDYKGKWKAPLIDNPAYKGEWKPRMISNPDYYEDKNPAKFNKMSGIGFELWTIQPDILFDNIFIGHNVADAEAFAEETWKSKIEVEKAEERKALGQDKKLPETEAEQVPFTMDPKGYVEGRLFSAISAAAGIPVDDLKAQRTLVLGGVTSVAVLLSVLGYAALSGARSFGRSAVGEAKKTDAVVPDDKREEGGQKQEGEEGTRRRTVKAKGEGLAEEEAKVAEKKAEVRTGSARSRSATASARDAAAADDG